jgi:hypothetical protein
MPKKLTQKFVDALPIGKLQTIRDAGVTGLLVKVGKTSASYAVQRELWTGERGSRRLVKTVRHTLGRTDALRLDAARTKALAVLSEIRAGRDPNAPKAAPHDVSVGAMFEQCAEHMRTLGRAQRSVEEFMYPLDKYLPHMKALPVASIKPSTLRAEHKRISADHGKVVANKAMRAYRSAFNVLRKTADDPDVLGDNPVRAVTFHPERRREAVLMPADLGDWYERIQALPNPLRRLMHELGLFSGLRPGTLVVLEKAWVRLDASAIEIPRMKTGRSFALPLSEHMVDLVRRVLDLSEIVHQGSAWLFPTRTADGREVIATRVWRERTMPGETGHILRATHRTLAKDAGVDDTDGDLLLDHKVAGIRGVYLRERALFERLLRAQEQATTHLRKLIRPPTR